MPRVRCRQCDTAVKISEREDRVIVRCHECGAKIDLDEIDDDDDEDGCRSVRRPRRRSKTGEEASLLAYYMNHWPQFVPIALVVPVTLFLTLLAIFSGTIAGIVMLLGLLVIIGAFGWSCVLMVKEGEYVSVDYLDGILGPIKWLVILFACGLYLMGYVALLVAAQINTAIQRPRIMVPWLLFQAYGVFLLFAAPVADSLGSRFRGPPRDFVQEDFRIQPNHPVVDPAKDQRPDNAKEKQKENDEQKLKEKEKEKEQQPPKMKEEEKPKPPEKPLPARITGDAKFDKALDDLEFGMGKPRTEALELLVAMKPNEHRRAVAKKLAEMAQGPIDYTRRLAVRPLGRWATPDEVPILIRFLADKDTNTRNEVLQFIGKHQDPRSVTPVVRCYMELGTTFHAEQALKDLGPLAEKEVLPLTMHRDFGVQVGAFRVLKDIGTEHSVAALETAAKGDIRTRDLAQQALTAIMARSKK